MLTIRLLSGQQEKQECNSKETLESEERIGYLLKGSVERHVCNRVLRYHLYLTEYDSHGKNLSYSVFSEVFGFFFKVCLKKQITFFHCLLGWGVQLSAKGKAADASLGKETKQKGKAGCCGVFLQFSLFF